MLGARSWPRDTFRLQLDKHRSWIRAAYVPSCALPFVSPFFFDTFNQLIELLRSWRATHHAHHKTVGSVERDENYVPYHRDDFNLPPRKEARKADYAEIFEETPLFTLLRVLIMQGLYVTFGLRMSRSY